LTDFASRFGRPPAVTASAPARVNLIGEHTDYNGGLVLPMTLPLRTTVQLALRDDRQVRAVTTSLPGGPAEAEYARGREARVHGWIDYVQAVTRALDEHHPDGPGADLLIESTVPVGGGLASSAALEVAVLRAFRAACALPLDDLAVAKIAHAAETGLVGAPVGIMDQMAASLGGEDAALFIDTRTLVTERVPLPEAAELAIIDSGIEHHHATNEYRVRREECERAASALGVPQLGDLGPSDLARVGALPPPLDRRARHVITEDARVLAAVDAMRRGALETLGRLWLESHASMRDDFEVSTPDVDCLVALAADQPGVFGARLTGGGFGGAVILLCARGRARSVADRIRADYHARTARDGRVLLPPDA
jgi:galactokinase